MKAKGIYEADDRGNVVDFYEVVDGKYKQVARLDREAEPDDHTTWDGGVDVTVWAIANGYAEEIAEAELIDAAASATRGEGGKG